MHDSNPTTYSNLCSVNDVKVSNVVDQRGRNIVAGAEESPDYLRELIKTTRTLTDKPFGVGVVLAFPFEENLKVILDEKVAVLQTYWGDCTRELVAKAHSAGVKVVPQVGSVKSAKQAIDAGVDGIIVQGREAGGHIIGQEFADSIGIPFMETSKKDATNVEAFMAMAALLGFRY